MPASPFSITKIPEAHGGAKRQKKQNEQNNWKQQWRPQQSSQASDFPATPLAAVKFG